jgi:repressor LexA|tara:strand:+ start:287 stop:484 length:198 start_codon:yes stop_codon:yes gene_type:complete
MTEKQKKVLDFVKKFLKDKGYGPSQTEVAKATGVNQSTARVHINQLIERGFLDQQPGKSRSLKVL